MRTPAAQPLGSKPIGPEPNDPHAVVLRALGEELSSALAELIENDDGTAPRPTDLRTQWELEQTFCVRVCAALRADDPFSTLYQLPAIANLRGLLEAARKRRVAPARVERAELAVESLRTLVEQLGGNKSHLDTLLSAHVPAARAKLVHASKQSIHHGMTRIIGAETEAALTSFFVYPNADDALKNDVLALYGSRGLRRLRPDLTTILGGRRAPDFDRLDLLSLARESLETSDFTSGGLATPLTEFCTQPLPEIEVRVDRDQILYLLPGWSESEREGALSVEPLTPEATLAAVSKIDYGEIDLFFASIDREVASCPHDTPRFQFLFVPRGPIRNLVFDIWIHRDLWREESQPVLDVGRADSVLATLPLAESSGQLHCESFEIRGSGKSAAKTRTLPRLDDMLEHVSESMPWSLDDFILTRTEVRYPVVGFKYQLDIERDGLVDSPD